MKRKTGSASSSSNKKTKIVTADQPIIISSQDSNNDVESNNQYFDPDTAILLNSDSDDDDIVIMKIPDDSEEVIVSDEPLYSDRKILSLVSSLRNNRFVSNTFNEIPKPLPKFTKPLLETNLIISPIDNSDDKFLITPTCNLIKEIPHEIIIDWMFYMDKKTLFNFIRVCKQVYNIFDEIYEESVDRLRLEILNNKRQSGELNRLLNLFSNEISERNGEKTMLTYDSYFRMKSFTNWPFSYFHDKTQFDTVLKEDDPQIKTINEKADEQMSHLLATNDIPGTGEHIFPYGLFPTKDMYYLTFNQLVKRNCVKGLDLTYTNEDYTYSDTFKIERVVTTDLYANTEKQYNIDYHAYVDKFTCPNTPFVERIVRFFKDPNEMTFSDFDNRFKNNFLSELARILIYDCVFEHNKTTKTRERFVVSGGSLLHNLTGCGCQDIDIFIINNQEPDEIVNQAIKQILLKFEEKTSNFKYNIMGSKTTINICEERPQVNISNGFRVDSHQNIQLVLLRYDSIEELLLFFDLDCCKLAYDGIRVFTVLECLRALKYKINFLPKRTGDTEINRTRAEKYGLRGFKTFTLHTDHPLSHAMHCDFVVEKLRDMITTNYHNAPLNQFSHRYNPTAQLFVRPQEFSYGKAPTQQSLDLDESTYLYPLVLRNVDYHFVDLCKSIGLRSALWQLRRSLSKERNCYIFNFLLNRDDDKSQYIAELKSNDAGSEKGIDEDHVGVIEKIISLDGYIFTDRPSELFQNLPKDHNFVKNKYSNAHLAQKYNILKCSRCGSYFSSADIASYFKKQLNNQGPIQFKIESCLKQNVESETSSTIEENNFNPEIHFCCNSCIKAVNGTIKQRAYKLARNHHGVSGAEQEIVVLLVRSNILTEKNGISKKNICETLEKHGYEIEELQAALYSLQHYRHLIVNTIDEEHVTLANRPIYSSNYELLYQPVGYSMASSSDMVFGNDFF